ncbi:MAG: Nif11-like leader peptide family natural product precursor [Alcaligenaceae bacterium]|nr:MAG: Nif11-like leader peptide family natural product precursor [Alcaligenaceae bacterium]
MSRENVQRFIARVSEDYALATKVKAIPAGAHAESEFAALAQSQGLAFSVDELRMEADRVATAGTGAQGTDQEGPSAEWVLDYFYGPDRKWTK